MKESADLFWSFGALQAAHDELLERYEQLGDSAEATAAFWSEVEEFLGRAQASGAMLDESIDRMERRASQSILDYWANALHRADRPFGDVRLAPFDEALAPELPDEPFPYQGLSAFDEDRHEFFFGREKLVDEMLEDLRGGKRLLIVLGASGSGKSSVVRAGLLQALKAGALPGSERWRYATMVPGADPLGNLERALERSAPQATGPEPVATSASLPDAGSAQPADDRPAGMVAGADGTPVVLLVDQFEELFTLSEDKETYHEFENRLLRMVDAPEPHHLVILTMRTDFAGKLQLVPELQRRLQTARVDVEALGIEELRGAILKPAAKIGLKFAPSVVDDLVAKILGVQAGLPLLQFTLQQLWQARRRNRVTKEVYEEVGDPLKALGKSADKFYDNLIPENKRVVRRIFLQMVRTEDREETSNRIRLEEVYRRGGAQDRVERMVHRLVCQARLVKLTGTTTDICSDSFAFRAGKLSALMEEEGKRGNVLQLEVAHEALVRNWDKLRDWMDAAHRLRLRVRALAGFSAVVALLLIAASIVAGVSIRNAAKARRSATALRLAVAADRNLNTDPELSLVLARYAAWETYKVDKTVIVEAESALHQALQVPLPGVTLSGHTGAVNGVAFSPDGERLASAGADGTVIVWDVETDEALLSLSGHAAAVNGVAFSPDGKWLATASADKTAKVWDAETGKELRTLRGHNAAVNGVAFSPDGVALATASADSTARVWRAQDGTLLRTLEGHTSYVNGVAFSPDGGLLATVSADTTVRLWEASDGSLLRTLEGHTSAVLDVAFSPDGTRLATASLDKTAKVWDAKTGEEVHTLAGHSGAVCGVAFSPDGTRVATASAGGTAKVWAAASGRELSTLSGHAKGVNDIVFHPDGTRIATASADSTAKLWNAEPAQPLTLIGHSEPVHGVAFGPDGERLATASADKTAIVWDARSGARGLTLTGHTGAVYNVVFSPDGETLATASEDGTAKLWIAETGREVDTLSGHSDAVRGVAFSPDGKRLATASADKTAIVWDARSGARSLTLTGHTGAVHNIAFSPDGTRLATASEDRTAKVWDAETGTELLTLAGHADAIRDVAFSPDGKLLATASADKTAIVWDASTGVTIVTLTGHTDAVYGVAFSPDGARLATASVDGTVKVWDAASGQELFSLSGRTGAVWAVATSPDGKRLASASADKTARLYVLDVATLIELAIERTSRELDPGQCMIYWREEKDCPPPVGAAK